MMSFSQSQTQYSQKLGSLPYTENIPQTKSENKTRIEIDSNDYFLKGFLIGYKREKDRIEEWRAKKEEKKKKEFLDANCDGELRRIISEMITKEVNSRLEEMKLNVNVLKQERMAENPAEEEEKVEVKEDEEELDEEVVETEVKVVTNEEEEEEDDKEEVEIEENLENRE